MVTRDAPLEKRAENEHNVVVCQLSLTHHYVQRKFPANRNGEHFVYYISKPCCRVCFPSRSQQKNPGCPRNPLAALTAPLPGVQR